MKIICTSILLLVILPIIIQSIPTNDLPCDAAEIYATDLPYFISTTTFGTSFEGVEPVLQNAGLDCTTVFISASTGGSIWFRVIGPITDLFISTCDGATWDTRISIFETPCDCSDYSPDSFICVTGNDDNCASGWQSEVTATGTYCELYIHIHGFWTAEGDVNINFEGSPAPECIISNPCTDTTTYSPTGNTDTPTYSPTGNTDTPTYSPTGNTDTPTYSPTGNTDTPTYSPTGNTDTPTYSPTNDDKDDDGDDEDRNDDDDDESSDEEGSDEKIFGAENILDLTDENNNKNDNDNIGYIFKFSDETIINVFGMVLVSIIAFIILVCFGCYKRKGQRSFKINTNEMNENV